MNEIVCAYKRGKYKKCLELLAASEETDDMVKNFLVENSKLICESYEVLFGNDPAKIYIMQEEHYNFFERVTSISRISNSISLELKLSVMFNFTFWLLFCNDIELDESEEIEYLEVINKGLLSVLGTHTNLAATSNVYRKILSNLMGLKDLILNQWSETIFLILEVVIIIIMYIVKLKKSLLEDCLKTITSFIKISKNVVNSVTFATDTKSTPLCLFKFSLCGNNTLLSDVDSGVIDYLHLLESVLFFLLEDFKNSLNSLQKNINPQKKSLWQYLVILNFYELGKWDLCSRYLSEMSTFVSDKNLMARYHIVQGKLNSARREHKKALIEFEKALSFCSNCPVIYYQIGQEYGKMGLIDLMVENFQKLTQVLQSDGLAEEFRPNFETTLLDWIHPGDEITEAEAYYALAVSYGLNESFKSAAETFEKVLKFPESYFLNGRKKRILKLPNYLTILHDAAVMNLLLGNLVRAEQISLEAIDRYVAQKSPEGCDRQVSLLCKDVEWLKRVIQQELLETDLELKVLPNEILYAEDLLFFLPQNVVALLVLSEIQRIQEIGKYKTTLNNIFSVFSKYLGLVQKRENLSEGEKQVTTLVKALASKTCVKIAAVQVKESSDLVVEKMYKRSLSCNKGDKDALFNYYEFLLMRGRKKEALKLWNTFFNVDNAIGIDSLQSFSLRYFLIDKITSRELEKIQKEMEATENKFSTL